MAVNGSNASLPTAAINLGVGNIQNGQLTPTHPNGGGNFLLWATDSVGLVSNDCTTVPVHVDVSGTPTTGESPGFTYNDGAGHSTNITTPATTGQTNAQLTAALSTAFKANATISTIFGGTCGDGESVSKIITNAFASGSTFYFNQFYPEQATATTVAINTAHTTITVSQGDARFDNNPYFSMSRHIQNRAPVAGDLLGALYPGIGDDSTSYTGTGQNVKYSQIFTRIADPAAAAPVGNVQIIEASGTGISLQATGTGIAGGALLFGTAGAVPAGGTAGFMGNGTWNVGTGYYVAGVSGLAIAGGNPSLGIGVAPSSGMPLDVLAANGGGGQARFRYDGNGSGFIIDQQTSGGKVLLVNQANNTLSFASNNGADQLTVNSAGHTSMGRNNSSDQGGVQAEVYGSGGFMVRFDGSGSGLLTTQASSGGAASIINQANSTLALGTNNATVITLSASGATTLGGSGVNTPVIITRSGIVATNNAFINLDGNAGAGDVAYGQIGINYTNVGAGTEAGDIFFKTVTGGAATERVRFFSTGGTEIGAPTGGDKGAGTLNLAGLLYNNGTAPTGSSGGYALAVSPSFTTPTLGVASATTINKWTFTAPTTAATLIAGADNVTYTGPAASKTLMASDFSNASNNGVTNAILAQAATNTVKGNATSGTANETDLAVGSCSAATNALIWTTNTGFGCNSNMVTTASSQTLTNKTITDVINQETHEDSFTSNTSSGFTTITNLDQTFTAAGKYSCNGHMHFTTAPTTSNGVKLQLATDGTSSITTLNFNAIGFNGAAFATSGTGTATALGSTAISSQNAFTDIILNGEIVVNVGGVIHVQFNEVATSGTIAGNARWDCHRAA